jgi:hypothetical protein
MEVRMSPARVEEIEAVITACEAKGIAWTNLLVFEEVGGQYQQISRYLKARRARAGVATGAASEDPPAWADDHLQDAPAGVEALEEDAAPVCPLATPVEPPMPPRLVPKLEALQQAVREADSTLVRVQRERDVQQQTVQMAALALYQAKREAQRFAKDLRAAVRQAQAARGPLQQDAQARVAELYTALSTLVGQHDAELIANDSHFTPSWLRG